MAEMNVALVIRFLTEGAQRVQRDLNSLREGATDFKRGLSGAIREGFSGQNIDAAVKNAEVSLGRARARLMDAAAMGVALAAPVRAAARFEEAFADLEKVLDAPIERLAEFKSSIIAMSGEIAVSANDLTAIMAAAAQGGVPTDALERFTSYTAQAAVAFDMAAGEIGNRFAKLRNVYRLDQEGLEQLGDAANHLSNSMAARADEITNFANRAAGAQRVLKLSAVEMAAVGAALTSAGVVPETAARGLSAFANRLVEGKDKVLEAFDAIGISYSDFLAALETDAPAALTDLFQTLSETPEGMRSLIGMMGQDFSDDFSKLLNNPDLLASAFEMVGDATTYAGSAVTEYEKRAATTMGRMELFKNQIGAIGITLGNTLLPALNEMMEKATAATAAIGAFANAHPQLASVITTSVAGLLTFGIATRAIGYAVALVRGPLIKLVGLFLRFNDTGKNVAVAAQAVRGLGITFTALKTVAVGALTAIGTASTPAIAAVAALSAAVLLVWKHWDRISSFVSGFASGVISALSPAAEAVGNLFSKLTEMLGIDLQPIADMFGRIGQAIGRAASAVGSFLGSLFSAEELTDEQKAAIASSGEQLGRALVEAIRDGIAAAWNTVVEWFSAAIARLGELLTFDIGFDWPEPPAWLSWMLGKGGDAETPAAPEVEKTGFNFPSLGNIFGGGDEVVAEMKDGAADAGQRLGETAGAELRTGADAAGRVFGRAAAAEISRAKINYRLPAIGASPAVIDTAKTGSLHDGVE